MKKQTKSSNTAMESALASELLILPDGRILVHNLTRPMADLLRGLNPKDKNFAPRAEKFRYL